jgi:hypothetical protein
MSWIFSFLHLSSNIPLRLEYDLLIIFHLSNFKENDSTFWLKYFISFHHLIFIEIVALIAQSHVLYGTWSMKIKYRSSTNFSANLKDVWKWFHFISFFSSWEKAENFKWEKISFLSKFKFSEINFFVSSQLAIDW